MHFKLEVKPTGTRHFGVKGQSQCHYLKSLSVCCLSQFQCQEASKYTRPVLEWNISPSQDLTHWICQSLNDKATWVDWTNLKLHSSLRDMAHQLTWVYTLNYSPRSHVSPDACWDKLNSNLSYNQSI